MKKIQNWICILAMLFLLVQSTIGVVTYINREDPSERMGMMMGQPPTNATDSTNANANTDTNTNSNTTENNNFSTGGQNGIPSFNGMEGRGGASMGNNESTASFVGYIAGIVLSLGGLVVTFLNWRKNKKMTIVEE